MNANARGHMLVACIGNIFLGDDGFGCAVARQLAGMEVPPDAEVVDYGIRGLDLAYALLDPYEAIVLVDAIVRNGPPGSIFLLQPAPPHNDPKAVAPASFDAHDMNPARLLSMARALGDISAEIYIVGCEPSDFGDELEGRMGLSDRVAESVPHAAGAVLHLIERIHRQRSRQARSQAGLACSIH